MTGAKAAWRAGMQAAQAEAGGAMRIHVLRPLDAVELLGAALCGDQEAARLMRAVSNTVSRIDRAPRHEPMLCGCCPAPLKSPNFCVGVAVPARDDPTSAIGFAICNRCANKAASLEQLAVEVLRRIWPDSRLVTVTDRVGGRA